MTFYIFLRYTVILHTWQRIQAFRTSVRTLIFHILVIICISRNSNRKCSALILVHSSCTNASLPQVYTSVIFERRLMTWIFAKKMSLWPTLMHSWRSVSRCFAKAAFLLHNPNSWRWQAVTCKVYFYYYFCCFNSQSLFSVSSFPFHMLIVIWTN